MLSKLKIFTPLSCAAAEKSDVCLVLTSWLVICLLLLEAFNRMDSNDLPWVLTEEETVPKKMLSPKLTPRTLLARLPFRFIISCLPRNNHLLSSQGCQMTPPDFASRLWISSAEHGGEG